MRTSLTPILALGLTLTAASAAAHAFERCEPFTVYSDHDSQFRTFVDHGEAGPGVGDRRIFHALFRDEAGNVVGEGDGELTVVHPDADGNTRFSADIFMQFPTGTINYKIAPALHEHDLAETSANPRASPEAPRFIVGGSGVFAGASGTVDVVHNADHTVFDVNVSCR